MKFVYLAHPIAWFRGYMFLQGKPTEVSDPYTISQLDKHPDYRRYDHAMPETSGRHAQSADPEAPRQNAHGADAKDASQEALRRPILHRVKR